MGTIAILGPGGVGGFVAAALARADESVTVVARRKAADHIAQHGLAVQSTRLGSFTARPEAVRELTEEAEVLIVATKAGGLGAGLELIRDVPGLVVPLLNGLEHMDVLRDRFGPARVAAGTIRIESDRRAPGQIVQTSPFLRVDLASRRPERRPDLARLAQRLERAEIPARVCQSEAQILWSKLVRLNALALTTSAADQSVGVIRTHPQWRAALKACIEETAVVAQAEGADIDPAPVLAELDVAHPGLRSSMQRDIAAGREPELDAIAGSILRAARRHGIECPEISRLTFAVAKRAGITPPQVALALRA
jgi:2-dehydropantoate 2-reductase